MTARMAVRAMPVDRPTPRRPTSTDAAAARDAAVESAVAALTAALFASPSWPDRHRINSVLTAARALHANTPPAPDAP